MTLPSIRSYIISTIVIACLCVSLPINAQCQQCADLIKKISCVIKNPRCATDKQIEEIFATLCKGMGCWCNVSKSVESLFADASLTRIKKYFNDHPDQLNQKELWRLAGFGDGVINSFAPILIACIDSVKNRQLIQYLLPRDPIVKERFITAVIANIAKLNKSSILITIASNDANILKRFIEALDKCDGLQPVITLFALTVNVQKNKFSDLNTYCWAIIKKKLAAIFPTKSKAITFEYLFLICLYKLANGSLPDGCSVPLQTAQHLFSLADKINDNQSYCYGQSPANSLLNYVSHERPKKTVDQIIALEQEFKDAGYYTFVHGQQWQYRLLEQWYTWLWELDQKRVAGDYRFIHCRKLKKSKVEKQRECRKKILENGRIDFKERKRLLFLNAPFFGNLTNQGSCTAYFAYSNSNINSCTISLSDIFKMFDCSDVYTNYKDELEVLQNEHATLSKRGQVLLLAIPKKIIKDCIYCAVPGGYKRKVMVDGKETEDIEAILEALRTDASRIDNPDCIEFCLVLTDDMLTPDSGIKVRSLTMADDKMIQEFDAKARSLFERMKQDLQQQCEQGQVIEHSVEQINELCEQLHGKDSAAIKEKIQREVLANLSDAERNVVKQRLLKCASSLQKICSVKDVFSKVILSPSGSVVGISCEENTLKIHNLLNGEDFTINHKLGRWVPQCIQYSPDERYLVFAENNILLIWDRITNAVKQINYASTQSICNIDVSDKYVAVGVCDRSNIMTPARYEILIYNLENNECIQKFESTCCYKLQFSADNEFLFSRDCDGYIDIREIASGTLKFRHLINQNVDGLAYVNGKDCIVAHEGGTIKILDLLTGNELRKLNLGTALPQQRTLQVKLSRDKKSVLMLMYDNSRSKTQICIKNLETDSETVYNIPLKEPYISDFNEKSFVRKSDDNSIALWAYDNPRSDLINQLFE